MCEPLREKKQEWLETECFHVDDIKSAVAFYKKYADNRSKLKRDHPDIFQRLRKERKGYGDMWGADWNELLFDYAFADVIQ